MKYVGMCMSWFIIVPQVRFCEINSNIQKFTIITIINIHYLYHDKIYSLLSKLSHSSSLVAATDTNNWLGANIGPIPIV